LSDCDDSDCASDAVCLPSTESNCSDGIDNDGDGLSDCDDSDCAADAVCLPSTESNCSDGVDNDGDGLSDCDDGDCDADSVCTTVTSSLLTEGFDSTDHGFVYTDDTFRGTSSPAYASGEYSSSDGFSGGGLHIALGGVDASDIFDGMSGSWSHSFSVPVAGDVNITLRYRLVHYGDFDSGECSQALVAVDGELLGEQSATEYLQEYCGLGDGNPTQDTGWQQVTLTLALSAGSHTLAVGGYLNQKTTTNEVSDIYFDEIEISGQSGGSETSCSDGLDNDGDGLTDCDDGDCEANTVCTGTGSDDILLESEFDADSDGFTYYDDTFRGTSRAAYASGDYSSSEGFSGGGLHVALGGVNANDILDGMSGGWSGNFSTATTGDVTISLRYRLIHYGDFDSGECGQALVAVDGTLLGAQNSEDYLEEYCGVGDGNPTQDSGWQQVNLTLFLNAGSHTLTMGGYLNQKTTTNEVMDVYFDEVIVTGAGSGSDIIFSDDFQDGAVDDWTVIDDAGRVSDWQVSNGKLVQYAERVSGWEQSYHLGSYAYLNNGSIMGLSDYRISADLRSTTEPYGLRDDVGIMLRYIDEDNYIRVGISKVQGFIRLEKKVGGDFSNLAFSGRPPELNTTIQVSVEMIDDTIFVYVNDEPLFGVTDSDFALGQTLDSGTVALFTQGSAEFDNVVVSSLDDTPKVIISAPMSYSVQNTGEDVQPYTLLASAVAANMPTGGGVRFSLDGGVVCDDYAAPYNTLDCSTESGFDNVAVGDHTITAVMINSSGQPLADSADKDQDVNAQIGVGGDYLVMFGDSISNGVGDDSDDPLLDTQNDSDNGKNLNRGAAPVINDFLSDQSGLPTVVYNEGLGGTTSQHGSSRLDSTLDRHPTSDAWLILFGTNDSGVSINLPDGSDCSETDFQNNVGSCIGTYKYYLREIILNLKSMDKTPLLAKVPYLLNAPQNQVDLVEKYNEVVDQLVEEHELAAQAPDLYTYFYDHQDTEFYDSLHPNGIGYATLARMWLCTLVPDLFSGTQPAFCSDF
ncbi:MAG: SGNH/GDSL hydrolase family protein, partial [Desulfobacteraceae bacterium]